MYLKVLIIICNFWSPKIKFFFFMEGSNDAEENGDCEEPPKKKRKKEKKVKKEDANRTVSCIEEVRNGLVGAMQMFQK